MNVPIEQRWKDYYVLISETARRFSSADGAPNDAVTSALVLFVNVDTPRSEAELEIRIGEGDQLQSDWHKQSNKSEAYADCENHASIPIPAETMAEQAEMARENPDD
jgi:hypothetical protein